jgi:hypothetical protein
MPNKGRSVNRVIMGPGREFLEMLQPLIKPWSIMRDMHVASFKDRFQGRGLHHFITLWRNTTDTP